VLNLSIVTAEDLGLRFFAPMREVSHALLDSPWPSLPSTSKKQKLLGVLRLHDDTSCENAEYANALVA
jgi:hypothetical protein